MKKRILSFVMAVLCLLGCAGCNVAQKDGETLTVICTVFPPYDFVRAIAPEAKVSLLESADKQHSYPEYHPAC